MTSRPIDAHPDFDNEFHSKSKELKIGVHPLMHEVNVASDPATLDFVIPLEDNLYCLTYANDSEMIVITFEIAYFDKIYWLSCEYV